MLLYLSYERNPKQWNIRVLILALICAVACLLLSFKFKKGGQKDLTLIVAELPLAYSGEIHLLTYNIAGLPQMLSSAQTAREPSIKRIGQLINDFDIVNVQEDFNYNKYLYEENNHSYRTANMGGVPFGDGLSTLSKYPIVNFERVAWKACNGADCLTPKGFSFSRVQLAKDVFVDVYNVHATAQDDLKATRARAQNLQQLAAYVEETSADQPLLLMGDFNAHYAFEMDWIKEFQEQLALEDSWVLLQNGGAFPRPVADFQAQPTLKITDECESIDKIYFRNNKTLVFKPSVYKVEHNLFENEIGKQLSDHCAVSLILGWSIKETGLN